MTTPKCVLFDLDGTLVDTAPDLAYAANCVRAEAGRPALPVALYRPVASAGARGLLKVALDLAPDHAEFPARRERFLEHYRQNIARESCVFPELEPVLRDFERRGLRWGVVTNKPAWLTQPLLQALKLSTRAACAIGMVEGLAPKPAPDSLLRACRELDLSPQDCIYVGDDKRDILAARAAGMPSVGAGWGYLGEDGPIESWGADTLAQTPAELARLCA